MRKTYKLSELDCANCAAKMEREIGRLKGVEEVNISFMTQRMVLAAPDDIYEDILEKAATICKKIEPDCVIIR